jgi:predicted nucleic acid-binding protein/antitoxin (DNA-binding transcriptional repressor) of toxin-antitoxin stability system
MKEINQRQLRNDSGEIMRGLDEGETYVVMRNGIPVGELTPLRRRRFVSTETAMAMLRGAPPADYRHLRRDLDAVASQDPRPRGWTPCSRARRHSVILDLERLDPMLLPLELAISALTLAELAAGPHVATTTKERGVRQERLQRVEATFDALPFDAGAARAYGRVYAAVTSTGRKARGARAVDLLIAATAAACDLPLYTRNVDDFRGLEDVVSVVAV